MIKNTIEYKPQGFFHLVGVIIILAIGSIGCIGTSTPSPLKLEGPSYSDSGSYQLRWSGTIYQSIFEIEEVEIYAGQSTTTKFFVDFETNHNFFDKPYGAIYEYRIRTVYFYTERGEPIYSSWSNTVRVEIAVEP